MKIIKLFTAFAFIASMTACTIVKEGDTGVQRTWGTVDHDETGTGLELYNPFVTTMFKMSIREIPIELDDMKPKAGDNLSMEDLDVTVYYRPTASRVSEIYTEYQGGSAESGGIIYPAYNIMFNLSKEAIYNTVSKFDSLVIHKNRDAIAKAIKETLDATDIVKKGDVTVTRIIIRAADTDPSIEASIQLNIQKQKKLEAKDKDIQIAAKDAEIEIALAHGIAKANDIINTSLTDKYLQHEQNLALMEFAKSGKHSTVVIPSHFTNSSLLIDAGSTIKQ